ncbi:MAG: T9SS type A sorting domain-containing protein [Sphingobacteriales bacterium]|nr:MAG: T9SS type A sorting domain-containing protein [Sphingobacteriales bacterium]
MKKSLFFAGLTLCSLGSLNAQVALTQDFNGLTAPAIPAGWASNPASAWTTGAPNTIAPNAQAGLGYNLNSAAYMKAFGVNGKLAIANNSLVTTETFALPATMPDASFIFDMAYFQVRLNSDTSKKEELFFVVSTDGGANWTTVETVSANQTYLWETRSINMAAYIGSTNLKVGFRYKNNGGELVGVVFDNFRIFSGKDARLNSATAGNHPANGMGYHQSGTATNVTGSVQNLGTSAITGYVVKYQQGANPVQSYTVSGASIAPLATANFSHNVPFTPAANQQYPLKVWVELTGDTNHANDSTNVTVVGVPFIPEKKILFEEGTGTWCGWCPRGAVAMEEFAVSHAGKAAQVAVHNGDGMAVSAYDSYMSSLNGGGFPNLVTDRTVELTTDPGDIESVYNSLKENFGFATLTMGTPTVTGTSVSIPLTIVPAVNMPNPRVALIVTESNVHSTRPGTGNQANYYANNARGPMGGWEAKGSSVANVNYHFIGRAVSPSPAGDAMGLPATLTANSTYNVTLTATLNAEWRTDHLQYIATLGDNNSKTIYNTAFSPLPLLEPGLPTTVANVDAGINKATLYPNPVTNGIANLEIDAMSAATLTYNITDLSGRVVLTGSKAAINSGLNTIQINTAALNSGLYMVNFATEKGNTTIKFQVIK